MGKLSTKAANDRMIKFGTFGRDSNQKGEEPITNKPPGRWRPDDAARARPHEKDLKIAMEFVLCPECGTEIDEIDDEVNDPRDAMCQQGHVLQFKKKNPVWHDGIHYQGFTVKEKNWDETYGLDWWIVWYPPHYFGGRLEYPSFWAAQVRDCEVHSFHDRGGGNRFYHIRHSHGDGELVKLPPKNRD